MNPLKAALFSNGIEGLKDLFHESEFITYELLEITKNFEPDLSKYDILIAPNGTDHIALYRIRDKIHAFLNAGNTLLCFDGWFTDWIPGNRWIMDNSKKTIDVRYNIKEDSFGLSSCFNIQDLNFSYGISGWWACGYIQAADDATIFIEDTWGRPLVVFDDASTNGLMVLSASAPLADGSYATTDDDKAYKAMSDLYKGIIQWVHQIKIPVS